MSILLEKFLIKNNYTHFTKNDISLQLLIHPNNPSFRAMTDTLDYFGIDNLAANVPEDALELLPNDFLTVIDENGSKLVLATKKNNCILTEDEEGKKIKHTTINFKKKWGKNIIAIEKTTNKRNFSRLKTYWSIVPFILFFTFLFFQQPSLLQLIKIMLSGIGLFISYLLVKEKIGYHSPSVLAVCTSLPNSNCNDVINSKGGNITKYVSLADASFLYFLILLFNIVLLDDNLTVSATLVIASPIILFSLYYQGFVIKKWCMLCLAVVLVLALLNVTLLWAINTEISVLKIIEFLCIVSLLLPAYFYVKNLIETNKKNNEEIIGSRRFKRNPEIVKNIMRDAEIVMDTEEFENEVIIGNRKGKHQIITYTNPLCGFCKKAFESYLKIISMNPEIHIIIRFNTQPNEKDAPTTQISCRLVEIFNENGEKNFISAYISWFQDKKTDEWLKKHNHPKFDQNVLLLFEKHRSWAKNNGVNYTPATIINNQIFPSSYGYDDLVYVINNILEFEIDKNENIEV